MEKEYLLLVLSLAEEIKCIKVRVQLLISRIKYVVVRCAVPNPTKGRKWNPSVAVQEEVAALRYAEILDIVHMRRGNLGLGSGKPAWKAGPKIKES